MAIDSYSGHCALAFLLRIVLVVYSKFHDERFDVPYTDVDYKVFTDAARHVVRGNSPYDRHTYRYTPLLALLLVPNVLVVQEFGKVVFSAVDVLVGVLIKRILTRDNLADKTAQRCGFLWLYNPLAIVVSTRGNADSLAVFFVLLSLYFLRNGRSCLAGIVHGFSIHLRLYPIAFSLSMYLALRRSKFAIVPNREQVILVVSCVGSLAFWTATCYYFYGYKFLHESFLYHLGRRDARHNFSVYFYMLYLSVDRELALWQRLFTFLPQLVLLLGLSFRYSTQRDLPFATLTQAFVMVAYNPVMTSQYFFWFLSLLPLCLPRITMSLRRRVALACAWIATQAIWLFTAYLLEFRGVDSFLYIWLAGLLFFAANVKILVDVARGYKSTEVAKEL